MNRIQIRHLIQSILFILTLLIGFQFLIYILQASGTDPITVPRPASIEGFLPIGALLGWKRFFATGSWDTVHPAAMVIFGFAIILSALLRKSFCSWFCPVGTLSEWLWKLGKKVFGRKISIPNWLDFVLRAIKYFLLGFFLWIILRMSAESIGLFLDSPYYKISDVKMLHFFTRMTKTTAIILAILAVGSTFVPNFWCRYFCPYGALLGLVSILSPSR